MERMKEPLFGKTLTELQEIVLAEGLPRYSAGQIAQWLYHKKVRTIEGMTNLSKAGRDKLKQKYSTGLHDARSMQESVDGTRKYLFPTHNGQFIETAYIPEKNRHTLCISTQVGCKMGCLFCMTGKQGFHGHLSAGEILNQVVSVPENEKLTNIVYMGMGEPLDNPDAVLKSIEILTSPWGFAWSPRRITVSTIGILPAMKDFLEKSQAHLAVSLHSPFDEERAYLMPLQKKYPISRVVDFVKKYDWHGQRRISFEYILFRGLNDTPAHVKELARLLNGLKCRINLIRYHEIPGVSLHSPSLHEVEQFSDRLQAKGLISTIRRSRGQDIAAACGLLSTQERKKQTTR
ncbi:MAG: 23S rRNA (adenine(2503)-C(2))-methyltransferase RlmN [Bacteroidales bacterium]|nr:23S rRNA (adenine(2503)-C(2))-methyltransferase RlmN [Bacteroidales bacterium]